MPDSPIVQYLSALGRDLRAGDATEGTYYGALEHLVESLQPGINALAHPKGRECGFPDFVVKKGDLAIGYIEAKDLGVSLDEAEKNEQIRVRYRPTLDNLILTNYVEFRWYLKGKSEKTATLGRVEDGRTITSHRPGQSDVLDLLGSFLAHKPKGADDAKDLSLRLARYAHEIRNVVVEGFARGYVSADLRDLRDAVKKELVPDLTDEQFADMFAQTLAYGFFAAWCHHPLNRPFERLGAARDIPKTNPFLRRLFEMTTGAQLDEEPFVGYVDRLVQLLQQTTRDEILRDFGRRTGREDPVLHFYETFLKEYDPKLRELRGVYYTPEPIISYMVRSADHLLRTRFGCANGLADTATVEYEVETDGRKAKKPCPRVLILDPACGTGGFLYAIVDHIREQFRRKEWGGSWSRYVRDQLLPRLFGFELLMAPYAVAHLKLGMQLAAQDLSDSQRAAWAYDFSGDERLGIYLTNTLDQAIRRSETLFYHLRVLTEEANAAVDIKRVKPIMAVIGNPPYSGHSANQSFQEIEVPKTRKTKVRRRDGSVFVEEKAVLRGRRPVTVKRRVLTFIGRLLQDYFRVDGHPLGERNPKMLQDDYVKFLRFAQWRIQQTGQGIVALITNHAYLDNPTFRGMRQQLMQAFTDIYLLDLHGNTRKKEVCPDGSKDENVFDIQQGVAIAIFVKHPSGAGSLLGGAGLHPAAQPDGRLETCPTVFHADLWGLRQHKEPFLSEHTCETIQWQQLHPRSPDYLFVPQDTDLLTEYERGWIITEVFPLRSVGIVTARDRLTIHFSAEETWSTVRDFIAQPPEQAREKYSLGSDVRDWKVSLAQEDLRASGPHRRNIVPLAYRPFDTRFTYYTSRTRGFICMPRPDVMRHMLAGHNTALCVGRAGVVVGGDEWNVAWCSRHVTDFNLFYRGGNCSFPLYLYPSSGGTAPLGGTGFQPVTDTGCKPVSPTPFPPIGEDLTITRRDLPHWQAGGSTYFITFRLKHPGATGFQPVSGTDSQSVPPNKTGGAGLQPALAPEERDLVKQTILFWHQKKWTVHALTVMPDHVHILATPLEQAPGSWYPLSEILHSIKRESARRINQARGRRGTLWLSGSFDRIVRDEHEFDEKANYILSNAVKANLAQDGWEYDTFWCEAKDRPQEHRLETCATTQARRPNLNPLLLADLEQRLSLRFIPDGQGDLSAAFGPEDVFNYIYAIPHCPTYRTRYAGFLKRDFPRIPFTSNRDLFGALAGKGADLVALHLLQSPVLDGVMPDFPATGPDTIERVHYNANEQRVYINKTQYFANLPANVWAFHVGGYQVCDKWLKDRKGRALTFDDQQHYQRITVALRETIRLISEIDALLPSWPIS